MYKRKSHEQKDILVNDVHIFFFSVTFKSCPMICTPFCTSTGMFRDIFFVSVLDTLHAADLATVMAPFGNRLSCNEVYITTCRFFTAYFIKKTVNLPRYCATILLEICGMLI